MLHVIPPSTALRAIWSRSASASRMSLSSRSMRFRILLQSASSSMTRHCTPYPKESGASATVATVPGTPVKDSESRKGIEP